MEKYTLPQDVPVFGFPVETFPDGIGAAFDKLKRMLPAGDDRPFYGLTEGTPTGMVYIAAALQKSAGEPEKYNCAPYTVAQGNYLTVTVRDWRTKTAAINGIFKEMLTDEQSDRIQPCVEIYKNTEEMLCLVKVDPTRTPETREYQAELGPEFERTAQELFQLISSFQPAEINLVPFAGSWTAGQIAEHLIQSNSGFVRIMNGPVRATTKKPDEQVARIKADFLDFSIKMEAPDFVVPAGKNYQKTDLLRSLADVQAQVNQALQTLDLTETCLALELPVYGFLTRLEALSFVVYHTQRHTHQLTNVLAKVTAPSA